MRLNFRQLPNGVRGWRESCDWIREVKGSTGSARPTKKEILRPGVIDTRGGVWLCDTQSVGWCEQRD